MGQSEPPTQNAEGWMVGGLTFLLGSSSLALNPNHNG
jgi:hypothetical protein